VFVNAADALVFRDARGREAVLAGPGAARRARLLPDQSLVLEVSGARPVSLPLPAWTPGWPPATADLLEVTGIRAVLDRLGIDSWDLSWDLSSGLSADADADAGQPPIAGRPRVVAPVAGGWRSWRWWWRPDIALRALAVAVTVAWVSVGVVRAIQGGSRPLPPAWLLTALALAIAAIGGWDWLRARAAASRAAAPPPDAVAVFAPTPAGHVTPAFSRLARLWATADGDIAIVDAAGREARLPGPVRGGVTEAVALAPKGGRPLAVSLLDGTGNVLAELPGTAWVGRGGAADRLAAVLDTAGVRWREQRAPQGTGFDDSQDHPLGPAAADAGLPVPGEMAFYLPMSAALVAVVALARQAWVALAVCLVIVAWSLCLRRPGRSGG
jgi:hypothetical protein